MLHFASNLYEILHRKFAKHCVECCEIRKNRHSKNHTSGPKCISAPTSNVGEICSPSAAYWLQILPQILSFPNISIYVYHHPVPKHEGQFPLSHPALMHLIFQILVFSDVIQLLCLLYKNTLHATYISLHNTIPNKSP